MIERTLEKFFAGISTGRRLYIAYSGGIDSSVLLHASRRVCQSSGHRLHALHIDHQLHADSKRWAQHCLDCCADLNIPIEIHSVDVRAFAGAGPEGAAREARYQCLAARLDQDDLLLTAHHGDDQVETVLLQLLRGSGVAGLCGCAPRRRLGRAWLLRPLLGLARTEIEAYASQHGLDYLLDPSNHSHVPDRNYLRHRVTPVLRARWPGLRAAISRCSQWQSESRQLLDALARQDLGSQCSNPLAVGRLADLSPLRLKNALRYWVRANQFPVPGAAILGHVISDAVNSRHDAQACVRWPGAEIRKYRQCLYIQAPLAAHDATVSYRWHISRRLTIAHLNLCLSRQDLQAYGVDLGGIDTLQVRFRRGGEVMRPRGRACSKALKNLFQEAAVAPWLRDRIPLLFHQETLIFVWGHWISEGY